VKALKIFMGFPAATSAPTAVAPIAFNDLLSKTGFLSQKCLRRHTAKRHQLSNQKQNQCAQPGARPQALRDAPGIRYGRWPCSYQPPGGHSRVLMRSTSASRRTPGLAKNCAISQAGEGLK